VIRLQPILLGFYLAAWTVALAHYLGLVSLAGGVALSLYGLYSIAAGLGWISGNVYVRRRQGLPGDIRRRLLVTYLCGPMAVVSLLRAMAPLADQRAAPLVPLWAFAVYTVFFLVPIALAPMAPRRR
jgi:hypothetical protein